MKGAPHGEARWHQLTKPPGVDPTYYTSISGAKADLRSVVGQQLLETLIAVARGSPSSTELRPDGSSHTLDAPLIDPEGVAAELEAIEEERANVNIQRAKADLKVSAEQREDINRQGLKSLEEMNAKALQALAKQGEADVGAWCQAIFGLIGSALAMVASIVATPLTLGAAAVGVAGAVVGVLMSVAEVANLGVKADKVTVKGADGKDKALEISIGAMVQAIVEEQVKGGLKFADEKQKQDYIMGMTIMANLFITAVMLASGGKGLYDAHKLAKTAADSVDNAKAVYELVKLGENAKVIQTATNGVGIVADIGESAGKIATAAVKIQTAEIQRDSEKAKAQRLFYDALAEVLASQMSNQMDRLKNNVNSFQETKGLSSSMLAAIAATRGRIVRNIG